MFYTLYIFQRNASNLIDCADNNDQTALHYAAKRGDLTVRKYQKTLIFSQCANKKTVISPILHSFLYKSQLFYIKQVEQNCLVTCILQNIF